MAKFKDIFRLFGGGGRKPQEFSGIRPVSSLRQAAGGDKLFQEFLGRLEGRGVGFDPSVLSKATAPFATSARGALAEETIPQIKQAASAAGVGRSTIVPAQVARASTLTERGIEERIAGLSLANEQQKRQEINDALARLQSFNVGDAATRAGRAAFDKSDFTRVQGELDAREARENEGLKNSLALAAAAAGGFVSGPAGAMAGANLSKAITGDMGSLGMEDLLSLKSLFSSGAGGGAELVKGVSGVSKPKLIGALGKQGNAFAQFTP